jgi:hypothetical protein
MQKTLSNLDESKSAQGKMKEEDKKIVNERSKN